MQAYTTLSDLINMDIITQFALTFSNHFILIRVAVDPEPIPRTLGMREEIHPGWNVKPSQGLNRDIMKE